MTPILLFAYIGPSRSEVSPPAKGASTASDTSLISSAGLLKRFTFTTRPHYWSEVTEGACKHRGGAYDASGRVV